MGNLLFHSNAAKAEEGESSSSSILAAHTNADWSAQWETQKKSADKLMVIDFKATWCGPCRMIAPAFKALADKYTEAVFVQIDVDELPEVSQSWNVNAMPTFLLLKGQKEVGRVVGAKQEELEAKIARCLQG